MIRTLSLKFGRAPGFQPQAICTTPVTVFVGPNNSGKSKTLKEIHQYCASGRKNITDVIVDQIGFEALPLNSVDDRIRKVTLSPRANETLEPDHIFVGKGRQRLKVRKDQLVASLVDPDAQPELFCPWYLAYNTLMLDGPSRIGLAIEQEAGNLQQAPQTSFQTLFRDNKNRAEVSRIVHEAVRSVFGD